MSFALVIDEADHGRINAILSRDLAQVVSETTTKANLHETEWKGEMTLKIKVVAEPNGNITLNFNESFKVEKEPLPKARMHHNPDTGALSNDVPQQVKIPGFDASGKAARTKN